jgi:hypothetical protein
MTDKQSFDVAFRIKFGTAAKRFMRCFRKDLSSKQTIMPTEPRHSSTNNADKRFPIQLYNSLSIKYTQVLNMFKNHITKTRRTRRFNGKITNFYRIR